MSRVPVGRREHQRAGAVIGDRSTPGCYRVGATANLEVPVVRLSCPRVENCAGKGARAQSDREIARAERARLADVLDSVDGHCRDIDLHLPGEHVLTSQRERAAGTPLPQRPTTTQFTDHTGDGKVVGKSSVCPRIDLRETLLGEHEIHRDLRDNCEGGRGRSRERFDISVHRQWGAGQDEVCRLALQSIVRKHQTRTLADDLRTDARNNRVVFIGQPRRALEEQHGILGWRQGRTGRPRPVGRIGPHSR